MKLAKEPYQATVMEDENGNRYILESAEKWNNVWILKNGEYRVVNNVMEIQQEAYVDVKKVRNHLLAYLPEYLLVLDENGNQLKDESGKTIVGETYQEAEDCLVVETQYNGAYVLFKKRIEHVKRAWILSVRTKTNCKFIGVIKLTYENKLFVETADSVQEIQEEVLTEEIYIEKFFYDISEKKKAVKIILYVEENTYATSLALGEKIRFVKLQKPLKDDCKDLPYHLMYQGSKGEKILHNVRKDTMIQTQNIADGVERWTAENDDATLCFWMINRKNNKVYTELYSETSGELIYTGYLQKLKRLEMQNSLCSLKYDAWIGTSYDNEENIIITTEGSEKIKFIKDYHAKDNYILCEQASLYGKDYYTLYCITDKIEKTLIERRFKEIPEIFVGTRDIVVISEEYYRYIYYKGILLGREDSDGTKYLQNDFSQKECQEQWQEIEEKDGFIKVPQYGNYFIDYRKNKAYSSFHPIYWWKKIVK